MADRDHIHPLMRELLADEKDAAERESLYRPVYPPYLTSRASAVLKAVEKQASLCDESTCENCRFAIRTIRGHVSSASGAMNPRAGAKMIRCTWTTASARCVGNVTKRSTLMSDATRTVLCFQGEEYEMTVDDPHDTCVGCKWISSLETAPCQNCERWSDDYGKQMFTKWTPKEEKP